MRHSFREVRIVGAEKTFRPFLTRCFEELNMEMVLLFYFEPFLVLVASPLKECVPKILIGVNGGQKKIMAELAIKYLLDQYKVNQVVNYSIFSKAAISGKFVIEHVAHSRDLKVKHYFGR